MLDNACQEIGYATRAVPVDHNIWGSVDLHRVLVFGVSTDDGGDEAAKWIEACMCRILAARQQKPPTPLSDVIDFEAEKLRVKGAGDVDSSGFAPLANSRAP